MKYEWLSRRGGKTAAVFFAGFASDARILSGVALPPADVCVVFDYSDFAFMEDFSAYEKVAVFGWSFGVKVADFITADWRNVASRTAICGTPFPVDDTLGIPRAIFEKTLDSFESVSEKFFRRVCGGDASLRRFLCDRPARELKAELAACAAFFAANPERQSQWDAAFACESDRIFPVENVARAVPNLSVWTGAHLNPKLLEYALNFPFRSAKKEAAFERYADCYDKCATVQKNAALYLREKLCGFFPDRVFENVFEFGCGTGFLTSQIKKYLHCKNYVVNDSSRLCVDVAAKFGASFCAGAIEDVAVRNSPDLVVSASCLQWVENRAGVYAKLHKAMRSGGVLALSSFGTENFSEIAALCGNSLEYDSLDAFRREIETAGFEILFCAQERIRLLFKSPLDVLRHIKTTGVNGQYASFWSRAKLEKFLAEYERRFSDCGGVPLTYNPMYVIAKKV